MSQTLRIVAVVAVVLALVGTAAPAGAQGRVKVGDELPYRVSTPAAYPLGGVDRPVSWSETVFSPGATFLRIHFNKFNLPDGDFLTVASPDGADFWTYTGKGPRGTGEFWSFIVESDTAIVELHSGSQLKGRGGRFGVAVDRIAHGTAPINEDGSLLEKVICGTDGKENVACHTEVNVRPVARLAFQSGGSSFVCTGWLVAGSNNSTMMTNNHCFTTQSEVNTVQARFNYQTTTCGGTTTATTTTYAGGTFLKTNSVNGGLDYTLFTLQGNPEATWGEYTATSKSPTTSMVINFPQHPGGRVKQIAYWKDSAHTLRCNVSTVNQTYGGSASGTQMGYSCDTEGGSSGSPVIDAGTGRVIGIHHFGGVSSSPCLNSATQMKHICSNAGSLLTCATN
ncbi:MAG TPA: trypsin-like peptidase domain-containing protein [Thermoanaerobaculia bacterium]|jgi:V8-like Glu-specific endopeptidase|nr:trypsin-like peptidase domain-containing protein [Thermoanaerobaculia bacterium]